MLRHLRVLTIGIAVGAILGWFARDLVPRTLQPEQGTEANQAIFDRIVGPVACPPRLVNAQLVLGCDAVALPESKDLYGWVDEITVSGSRLLVRGWAIDRTNSAPAKLILVVVDKTLKLSAQPNKDRDDVVSEYGKASLRYSGYDVDLSIPDGFQLSDHDIKVFAVAANGTARELEYGPKAKLK